MTAVLPKVVFVAIALVHTAASAAHLSFSASVDSFSVTGSSRTPFVDDFDDGVISPWVAPFGSPVEIGGFVELASPGSARIFNEQAFDREDIALLDITFDGGGDYIAESAWLAAVPAIDTGFFMFSNEVPGGGGFRAILIGLIFAGPVSELDGLVIFHQVATDVGGDAAFTESVQIAEADLTSATDGRILLRQVFDDTTNQLTSSYSLDGGGTYSSFAPQTLNQTNGQFWLGALALPEPSASVLMALLLILVSLRRITWPATPRAVRVRSDED